MGEVTQLLEAIPQGDPKAAQELLPLVYDELRQLAAHRMASERPGQTLQPTALVHEAYLRLTQGGQGRQWDGRGHFFAAAGEAMRRILVESARRKQCLKHGGKMDRVDFEEVEIASGNNFPRGQPLAWLAGWLSTEALQIEMGQPQ